MYYGLLALLTRALRLDARQLRNHLFRLSFVGFIYLCMLMATFTSTSIGAPGLKFFESIAWLNAIFITCAGVGFFSSAITEEKEEETIGLLQMAGLNHIGILLGKSTSRLIQVMLLLIVQFPFMLLAVTLGGVTNLQIVAAYVDLIAYTVLLANIGLVCSVVFHRGGTAAAVTTLTLVAYALLPQLAKLQLGDLVATGWTHAVWWQSLTMVTLEWIEKSCVFYQLNDVMQTGFNAPILTHQVLSNIGAGIFCFGVAWFLFGPSVNNAPSGGVSRNYLLKSTSRVAFLSPGRCWGNPFIWKDFQFIGGGYLLGVGKLCLYFAILLAIVTISQFRGNWFDLTPEQIAPIYTGCMGAALILEACVSASRIFHEEIRLQTMSSLLMLPRSIPYVGYSKALGCLMGLLPAGICLVLGLMQLPMYGRTNLSTILINPGLWAAIMTFLIFLHLIALMSLFVKWGALPAAVFLMAPVVFCCPVWQLVFMAVSSNGLTEMWGELPATITVWILTGLVCFVFQMMIAARLQELGTK